MNGVNIFMPTREERTLLGGFYLSSFVSELLNVALPFQFIFLLLVMDKPEWAVIPLIVEGVVVFLFEIPTGAVADRFGRKISVVIGDLLSGISWLIVPFAVFLEGPAQLALVCFAFALEGIGQTLVSGAEEAWVIDNLIAQKREDMSDQFFAREKSISSLGGVISGLVVWLILTLGQATTAVIVGLWIVSGFGQIISAVIQMAIPEHAVASSEAGEDDRVRRSELPGAFKAVFRTRVLLAFTGVILITSLATAVTGDVFEISMFANGMNPKELAPLAVLTDLIGFGTPLLAVIAARAIGPFNFLAALLVVTVLAALSFFLSPPLLVIVGLFLLFNLIDDLWDPIADAVMHSYVPSNVRATATSIINQLSELVGLVGLIVFGLMVGQHSEKIQEAIPDLVEAFQGVEAQTLNMPIGLFGLPIQDAAIVLFALVGVLAVPLLLLFPWHRDARDVRLPDENDGLQVSSLVAADAARVQSKADRGHAEGRATSGSIELTPGASAAVPAQIARRLTQTKTALDAALEKHNPGEFLSWNVADTAFELPSHTMGDLERIGPYLTKFFEAANGIYARHPWVRERLEKNITPNYARLTACQPNALPRLIRPDVVCNAKWVPKLVELEITVGARADTAAMSTYYGNAGPNSLLTHYAAMAKKLAADGKTLALVTAPHPFFLDLPDDALSFASQLTEYGVINIVVLTERNLSALRFDGRHLVLHERFKSPVTIHAIDRFIDIYEIAELQHAGMGAILDAYVAGAIVDVNTSNQFLDEKDWMGLFWLDDLQSEWEDVLGTKGIEILRRHIPKTWSITSDLIVTLDNGSRIPVTELAQVRPELRNFVIKESGTSTTASGAQGFYPIATMEPDDIEEVLEKIFESGVEYILQELVESPRTAYYDINPDTDEMRRVENARFKLSPFYIDGTLSDIRYVASEKTYAVNDDEECVVSVVARS